MHGGSHPIPQYSIHSSRRKHFRSKTRCSAVVLYSSIPPVPALPCQIPNTVSIYNNPCEEQPTDIQTVHNGSRHLSRCLQYYSSLWTRHTKTTADSTQPNTDTRPPGGGPLKCRTIICAKDNQSTNQPTTKTSLTGSAETRVIPRRRVSLARYSRRPPLPLPPSSYPTPQTTHLPDTAKGDLRRPVRRFGPCRQARAS